MLLANGTTSRVEEIEEIMASTVSPGGAGVPPVVHRLIEHHAALRGEDTAILHDDRAMSWRELNHGANVVARQLMAMGFRRGGRARVSMAPCADLAVVLLAVLKTGGCYAWTPEAPGPAAIAFSGPGADAPVLVSMGHLLAGRRGPSPNLPVMVRPSDPACMLEEGPDAMVLPHASLAGLQPTNVPPCTDWTGEPGALGLWMLLVAGLGATVAPRTGGREAA